MKPIDIPIVGIGIGPGTQQRPEDEMDILNLPSGSMSTYQPPILPEPEEIEDLTVGKAVLEAMLSALREYKHGDPARIINLGDIDAANLDLVNQALGEGEVSLTVEGPAPVIAQESVLAGIWRVQHLDGERRVIRDTIEIADIPHCVTAETFANAAELPSKALSEVEMQLMNAPSLLIEIHDQLQARQPGDLPHVINLTLLPLTEQELEWLGSRVGVGPTTILSRGYGNCRIGSTAVKDVWWIKYFNSEDKLILNSIEIGGTPEVALAAPEDIKDSAERLDEILELYR
ncbi:hydrogenase expression/formation C-terminal domain-containing protein [Granulosicoccaceae sp. 1_MG-2023]|nr:hydrogenase expression/formation C-terminal domain-containing protein [Granulosicoccaceae sp. 1_MG-2023]